MEVSIRRAIRPGAGLKRRDFITLMGGGAAAWPLARARSSRVRYRRSDFSVAPRPRLEAMDKGLTTGLADTGWIDGRYCQHRIPLGRRPIATACRASRPNLSSCKVDGDRYARRQRNAQAKAADREIPIVFAIGADPVETGLVDKPQPARRQCHGRDARWPDARRQTARTTSRGSYQSIRVVAFLVNVDLSGHDAARLTKIKTAVRQSRVRIRLVIEMPPSRGYRSRVRRDSSDTCRCGLRRSADPLMDTNRDASTRRARGR